MDIDRTGKCIYCETHEILHGNYCTCRNPHPAVKLRLTHHLAGAYPERFLPQAIDGKCENRQLKNYNGGKND